MADPRTDRNGVMETVLRDGNYLPDDVAVARYVPLWKSNASAPFYPDDTGRNAFRGIRAATACSMSDTRRKAITLITIQ